MYKDKVLECCPLFKNISKSDRDLLLTELRASEKKYVKGENIIKSYESPNKIGVIANGKVISYRIDTDGNLIILAVLNEGEVFGQALSNTDTFTDVNVTAQVDTEIIWLDVKNLVLASSFTMKFMHNLTHMLSEKIIAFNSRINILSKKTIRLRIITMLNMYRKKEIQLPFNRNEMADFLGVDRTALSRELSKMKSEGILDYNKNTFILLQ